MTSNIGSAYLLDGIDDQGDISGQSQELVMNDLRAHFRPEFLNRLDEIIMFKPLTKDNIRHIIDIMVDRLNKRIANRELSIELTDAAAAYITDHGYDPVYGARPLNRFLQKHVETLVGRMILSDDVRAGDVIVIDCENEDSGLAAKIRQNVQAS